jgi:hypothetical protein
MTKAERIRKLYADGFLSVKEIAALVGCRPEYVRVSARQRAGGRRSTSDQNYEAAGYEKGNREAARAARRAAYRALRESGLRADEASRKSGHAYKKTMRETGRHG